MVGRLVQQQRVGLRDPGAGEQREALPAAAQGRDLAVGQFVWRRELVQYRVHSPSLALACREGAAHDLPKGQS